MTAQFGIKLLVNKAMRLDRKLRKAALDYWISSFLTSKGLKGILGSPSERLMEVGRITLVLLLHILGFSVIFLKNRYWYSPFVCVLLLAQRGASTWYGCVSPEKRPLLTLHLILEGSIQF